MTKKKKTKRHTIAHRRQRRKLKTEQKVKSQKK